MKYWAIAISKDNYLISVKNKLLGFSSSRGGHMKRLSIGDRFTFYVAREKIDKESAKIQSFFGQFEIASDSYPDDKKIWQPKEDGDIFPYRRDINVIDEKKSAPIQQLFANLSFIKDMRYWAVAFRNGQVELTKEDWEAIMRNMK